jgi:hypothetical protein
MFSAASYKRNDARPLGARLFGLRMATNCAFLSMRNKSSKKWLFMASISVSDFLCYAVFVAAY